MELRHQIDDDLMERIQRVTALERGADVSREALAFYDWAVHQMADGREIISRGTDGREMVPVNPVFSRIQAHGEERG